MSDARNSFFQSLGLTPPTPVSDGSFIGGAAGSGGGTSDPDFFYPSGLGRYLKVDVENSNITLGSAEDDTILFATIIAKANISSMDETRDGGVHRGVLYGVQGTYDVLLSVNDIDGDVNHYSNFFKDGDGGLTPYRSVDEIVELFNGRPQEVVGTIRAGGVNQYGVILTIDPTDDSIKRRHYFEDTPNTELPAIVTAKNPFYVKLLEIDGILYGTCSAGGPTGQGAIFEYTVSSGA